MTSTARKSQGVNRKTVYDVIVVGGGPAGSVMAWSLASAGISVLLLERANFPREKVCGDFIEPRGLKILDQLGCLQSLEEASPLPTTHVAMFLRSQCAYRGEIPFYGQEDSLPPHGYIIPRDILDNSILRCAEKAGATIRERSAVKSVTTAQNGVLVVAQHGPKQQSYRANLVVGADGVNSIVARSAGLLEQDPRYIAVSQRGYIEGLKGRAGEAAFFFDQNLFPGYGWMFPMSGGTANIGVGILSETQQRYRINVPQLYEDFIVSLRGSSAEYSDIRVTGRPLGGIVKTYGGAGPNHFDRGILIGDAGCFVDPMTGEGISPAMESALIGSSVLVESLEQGRFDAGFLASYEKAFRAYFDPAWNYVDLCACLMRNKSLGDSWLTAVARGCEMAQRDTHFARIGGSTFGGLKVEPLNIMANIWEKTAGELANQVLKAWPEAITGNTQPARELFGELSAWQNGWWNSALSDPLWHSGWTADVIKKWFKVVGAIPASGIVDRTSETDRVVGLGKVR